MSSLILYGFQGCGKTYFGKLLANELGCVFIDTDERIEQEHGPCRCVVERFGEPYFRELEAKVIQELKWEGFAVISVGGGAVLNEASCLKLKALGTLVYLEHDKEVIKERSFEKGVPSYLAHESFDEMYEKRKMVYESLSKNKVSLKEKTDRQVLEELKRV